MRTLHFGLCVADLDRSLAFYTAVGYQVVGSVPGTSLGHLTMLKLPGDEFVTIELVHDPARGEVNFSTGLSHFVSRSSRWMQPSVSLRRGASVPRRPYHRMVQTTSGRHG
jgi:catechol 2,3-dioxygenase-like lactoylglutathione lyase family enzyme